MQNKRELLARVLDRARAFDLILYARRRVRVPVLSALCYHSVGTVDPAYRFDSDVIDATPDEFRQQLEVLHRHCTVISIDDLCDIVAGSAPPPNPVLITFDDGYRSCLDVALPILQEFGFPATFFIATDYVSNRRLYWWDTISYVLKTTRKHRIELAYPRTMTFELNGEGAGNAAGKSTAIGQLLRLVKTEREMDLDEFLAGLIGAAEIEWTRDIESRLADELIMTWDDVRKLRDAGMDIESHTRKHRVLHTLHTEKLASELAGSRADIEREIGEPVRTLAYPVGGSIARYPEIRAAMERAGYQIGFTAMTGVNYLWRQIDRLDVSRLAMERGTPIEFFRGMLALPPLAYSRAQP
ncbi:MAG: polysaccharide deacetylase family protein [Proteobacteria bacterium]|nr:polysaccharide deacetylase family protein [Pseudomonadota bacterium]